MHSVIASPLTGLCEDGWFSPQLFSFGVNAQMTKVFLYGANRHIAMSQ